MFLPESYAPSKAYSETKATQIDEEISRMMEEAHQRVKGILSSRREVLDELAQLLSEQEIMPGEELRKMLGKTPPGIVPDPA